MGERGEFPENIEEVVDGFERDLIGEARDHANALRGILQACESPAEQLFLARFTAMAKLYPWCSVKRESWSTGPYDLQGTQRLPFDHPHLSWEWTALQAAPDGTDRLRFELYVQVPVVFEPDSYPRREASYRLDFLIVIEPDRWRWPHDPTENPVHNVPPAYVAVEVDGHDYHERTKAQAARDRQRDRDLQSIGVSTVRFTASEVYHDEEGALCLQAWRAAWKRAVELGLPQTTERGLR